MSKFLKQIKRHPLSIGFFIFCVIGSLVEMNPAPIVIGLVICPLSYVIWELLFIHLEFMQVIWDNVFRYTKRK